MGVFNLCLNYALQLLTESKDNVIYFAKLGFKKILKVNVPDNLKPNVIFSVIKFFSRQLKEDLN